MPKNRLILFVFLLIFFFSLSFAQEQVNVSGDWTLTFTTPRGEMTQDMTIVQEGESIKVTLTSPRGEATGEGTIKGNEIEWKVTRTTPRGEMTSTYKGTVEGDNMSGQVQMGDFSAEWKATRKK